MSYLIQRLRNRLDRRWFDFRSGGVYQTPPVVCDPGSAIVVVSQLHHPDMTMYLLAAKSFGSYLRPGGFVIVDDGLTDEDKVTLEEHLGLVRIVPRTSVDVGPCPRGGCWERLLTLSSENQDNYVIQLDSDTLTLAEPTEVIECVASRRSFTLGTGSGRDFVSVSEAARFAGCNKSTHVQSCAERVLDKLLGAPLGRYVRGCAGFTGFAPGELVRSSIERFSVEMQDLVGEAKWREWGSEQVASNYMVSNTATPVVLPVERYPFWAPGIDASTAAFVHFFGTFRFHAGFYLQSALSVIGQVGASK